MMQDTNVEENQVVVRGYYEGKLVRCAWSSLKVLDDKYSSIVLKLAIHGKTWVKLPKGAVLEFILV
jgi:hypothetical protein